MVRKKGDSLPVETLKRLGVNVCRCSCGMLFNATQKPSFNVMLFVDGELVDAEEPTWFCSHKCAEQSAAERNDVDYGDDYHRQYMAWTNK